MPLSSPRERRRNVTMSEDKTEETIQSEEVNTEASEGEAIDVEIADAAPDNNDPTESQDSSEEEVLSNDPVTLTAEEHRTLTEEAAKAGANWDKYVRLNAEFDNFKKRAARDRQEAIRYANESLLETLIPTLDNFEMAMMAVETASADSIDSLKQGITMVHKQLKDAIKEAGMEEIDAAGQSFDPTWHEALSQQETSDVPEGQIVQQLRKGYKLRDRLIRPANVIVAKAASESPEEADS